MKVVLDTNILISSLFWGGIPRRIVDLAISGHIQSVTSWEILNELQAVLSEDFQMPLVKVKDILRDVLSFSQLVKSKPLNMKIRDLDDVKIIATAVAAKADYIVTGDKDLLALHQFDKIRVVTPSDFIKRYTVF